MPKASIHFTRNFLGRRGGDIGAPFPIGPALASLLFDLPRNIGKGTCPVLNTPHRVRREAPTLQNLYDLKVGVHKN